MDKWMNFEDFTSVIVKIFEEKYSDYEISVKETLKNNGTKLHGLVMKEPDSAVAPVIYIDELYAQFKNGRDIQNIVGQIMEIYENAKIEEKLPIRHITEFEYVKNRICYKLVNFEKNKEMLQGMPNRQYYDLAIIYYIPMQMLEENVHITVYNTLLQQWDVEEESLYELAKVNTPLLYKSRIIYMPDLLKQLSGEESEEKLLFGITDEEIEEPFPMYIVTNDDQMNGAAVLLYDRMLQDFAEKIQGDFYVLPSSTHEVICVPKREAMDAKELIQMVREINHTVVMQEEVLSENIYLYHAEEKKIEMITF